MSTATCRSSVHEAGPAWLPVLSRFARLWHRHTPLLDVEALPEHLRRDLGLAGGRPAPRRDPLYD